MTIGKWITGLPLLALLCAAQDRLASEAVIRTSTRLVEVSVIVHGRNGAVTDLAKSDFNLTDRGKPREISVFSVQRGDDESARPDHLPRNTFSNCRRGAPSSVTVILLDGLNTQFDDQASAKRHLIRFLKTVDPQDRIALYTLGKSLHVLCDFDHPENLRRILAGHTGSVTTDFATAEPEPADTGITDLDQFLNQSNQALASAVNLDRARITIDAFLSIANHLAQLPGRKNVIWVTGGLPFSIAGAARALNSANIGLYPVDARGLLGLPAILTASGPGYGRTIRPGSISFRPAGLDTLHELADLTGGRAFYDTNDISGAIRAAVQDTIVTYSLGFYPDPYSLDGKFHELKVQVKRPGLEARYRRGYYAVKDSPASESVSLNNLGTALWSPLESSAIALEAHVQRTDQQQLEIDWSVDISTLHLLLEKDILQGAINVLFVQQDAAGRELDRAQEAFYVHVPQEKYEAYLKSGIHTHRLLEAQEGLVTLRILLINRNDASVGSLVIPLGEVK